MVCICGLCGADGRDCYRRGIHAAPFYDLQIVAFVAAHLAALLYPCSGSQRVGALCGKYVIYTAAGSHAGGKVRFRQNPQGHCTDRGDHGNFKLYPFPGQRPVRRQRRSICLHPADIICKFPAGGDPPHFYFSGSCFHRTAGGGRPLCEG